MKPKRIQRKRSKGWKKPKGAVYVGRPSYWGNPFRVGDKNSKGIELKTPSMVVEEYRRYINNDVELQLDAQEMLRGKTLMCWCAEGEPCHAYVLLRIANE